MRRTKNRNAKQAQEKKQKQKKNCGNGNIQIYSVVVLEQDKKQNYEYITCFGKKKWCYESSSLLGATKRTVMHGVKECDSKMNDSSDGSTNV